MYKPVYIPATPLDFPFPYGSNMLWVPAALWSYIDSILASGDWTYFRIRQGCSTEIVKVIALITPVTLVVMRHQEYTEEESFSVGAIIDHTDTVSGVQDGIAPITLALTEGGAIEIEDRQINYPVVDIIVQGALESFGSDGQLKVGPKAGAFGCCDANNDPLPV